MKIDIGKWYMKVLSCTRHVHETFLVCKNDKYMYMIISPDLCYACENFHFLRSSYSRGLT